MAAHLKASSRSRRFRNIPGSSVPGKRKWLRGAEEESDKDTEEESDEEDFHRT